ncbi:uncharacterized protein LOC135848258 isoform X4 [Planococcus citri]|uniref:uncharacterized protein LOC135848258 isoform X4 n=1 Tax=Planococcus citri TaxID=170843 RepID=UPI0031F911C5
MDEIIDDLSGAIQPAPVDLKELSVITIARDIWRCELNYYRTNDELEKFDPKKLRIPLKTSFPDLPTVIYNMIEEYVTKFGLSMKSWLKENYKRVFFLHYTHENYVLEDFDDFVYDDDGTIDYSCTAERMMRCNKFGDVEKFKIACTYFFEDYIRRSWPSMRKKIGLNGIHFRDCPQLYYWICSLRNELRKIPSNHHTVDRVMFDYYMPYNRLSVEYFWNRMAHQDQFQRAVELHEQDIDTFVRFILPKFDERQFDQFVDRKGSDLICGLLKNRYSDERVVLGTWLSMKNKIKERNFIALVVGMLETECTRHDHNLKRLFLCRKIWDSVPKDLKRLATKQVSTKLYLFNSYQRLENRLNTSEFLLTVLKSATFEERSSFWFNSWENLILGKSVDDLQQIMKLCFENDDAIIVFKEELSKSKDVQNLCVELIKEPNFEELNDFVNFCYLNEDTARLYKQQLLQSNFLDGRSVFRYQHFSHSTQFNKFICDAYNNDDLATDFKNQLFLSPVVQDHLPRWVFSVVIKEWNRFIEFFDTFVSSERMMQEIKTRLINYTRQFMGSNDFRREIYTSSFDPFLLWCLGSDRKVGEFRRGNL